MVVGTIIGASIFVQPSLITGHVPSIAGVFTVWAAAGLLTLFGALVCAELASAYPRTGGVYVFLKEEFSPAVGFLWGWAMFWSMHSGIVAAIAVVFARYAAYFMPLGDMGVQLAAIAAIVVLSAVNYLGVREGSALQTAFTIGKVVAVVGIVVVGLALGSRVPEHFAVSAAGAGPAAEAVDAVGGVCGFVLALIAGLFAFGGWHMVTYAGDETIEPERTIPRALLIGTLTVTVWYIALNAVYLYILPLETVISSSRVAADAADTVLGYGGGAAGVRGRARALPRHPVGAGASRRRDPVFGRAARPRFPRVPRVPGPDQQAAQRVPPPLLLRHGELRRPGTAPGVGVRGAGATVGR
jgi:APA family basic amino acid/polyamine antiporter